MKRDFIESIVPGDIVAWSDIPLDVTRSIILSLYGISPEIVLVCREWHQWVEQHQEWFERAKELYLPFSKTYFHTKENFKRLSELDEKEKGNYSVYGGEGRNDFETIVIYRGLPKWVSFNNLARDSLFSSIERVLVYLEYFMPQDESSRLKNYIGRLLVAKFLKLITLGKEILWQDLPTLSAILVFVKEETSSVLTRRNFHPRDLQISFKEDGHQYTLTFWCPEKSRFLTIKSTKSSEHDDDNDSLNLPLHDSEQIKSRGEAWYYWLLSGTGFIGSLFPPFDALEAARNRHDRTVPDEVIIEEWKEVGRIASEEGTKMHLAYENDALDKGLDMSNPSTPLYLEYKAKIVIGKMRPYMAEWKIWCPILMICGSVDILYEEWPPRKCPGRDPRKKYLFLGDYKRSKEIKLFNPYQSGIPECSAVANAGDCNYLHYMIQLNLYKYILEKYYDVIILQTFIIVLHPNQDHYIKMNLNPPPGFIESIVDYRLKTLAQHRAEFRTCQTRA